MARIDGDKLAITSGGLDVIMLEPLGTVPGVRITLAAGLHRPGKGILHYDGSSELSWQAPGSGTGGDGVDVSAGGSFVIRDGADPDKWLEVAVTAASLADSIQWARVELSDKLNNAIGSVDRVHDAGAVTWSVTVTNNAGEQISNITAWLDPDTPENRELAIRWGAGGYVTPWNETEGQSQFGEHDLADTASETFGFQRTVADVASHRRLLRGWISFDDGEGGRTTVEFRGVYRITDDAVYEAYQADGADPVPGIDTPVDTNPSVPWTPSDAFGDATHHLAVTYVNAYGLRSSPRRVVRKRIVAGAEAELEPNAPSELRLIPLADGGTRVLARYLRPADSDREATQFLVWYTTDGSTPGSGDPDYTKTIRWVDGGYGLLDMDDIPAQADDVVVKVAVKTQRQSVASATSKTGNYTVERDGPSAPLGGKMKS